MSTARWTDATDRDAVPAAIVMRRLGTVTRTAQGLAVVRCDEGSDAPDIGTTAVDDSLSDVGRVVDVFGPVSRPYLAVSPADHVRLPDLLGTTLYAR